MSKVTGYGLHKQELIASSSSIGFYLFIAQNGSGALTAS